MGVADGEPNAKLLRTLLTEDERAILNRAKDGSRPLEERVDQPGYLAKALGGSGVSAAAIGAAAAAFTGNPLVGVGIAVPTIVNAAVGSIAERHLDRQKAIGRKPAYTADRRQREYDHPGLLALLDGPERERPPIVKMPKATAWRNYLRRHALPTLATAAVAGALTPFGVPALSTAMVIASSALAKSLAERLVDTKKLEFRLRRIDATERLRLSDPTLYVNQLATEFAELRIRLDRVAAQSGAGTASGDTPAVSDVPGAPPFTVSLYAQLIENVSGAARRAFIGGRPATDVDPTALARHVNAQMEGLLSAVGPGLLGAVTGAVGDKYFLNRDEAARDASKQWSRTYQEAAQAEALAELVAPRLRELRDLIDTLEAATGVPPDLSNRDLPVVTERPTGPRPPARPSWSTYATQVAAGALGGVTGAVGLDLPDLAVVLTTAGAAGSVAATPTARYLFRTRELKVHEGLETNKAVRAELENLPTAHPESPHDRDIRTARVQSLEQIDHRTTELDRLEGLALPAEPLAAAHENLRRAIDHYESLTNTNGTRRTFPDLATVDRTQGQRLAPGTTAQIRAGVDLAVRRLVAEPTGKPLLTERLLTPTPFG